MIWVEHFDDAAGWLAWLASTNAQAAVLIVFVLALRAAMGRRLTPGWRGALWLLIALRLLVPMAIESRYSLAGLGRQIAALRPTSPAAVAPAPRRAVDGPRVDVTYGPIPGVAAPAPRVVVAKPLPPYEKIAVAAWLGVAALLFLRQLVGTIALRRATRRMRPIDDADTLALLARCAADVGVRQRLRIVETERLRAPAVCGILRPILLLPAGATRSFTPADLRLMVMHELVHVRRDDVLVAAAFRFCATLHWFNPFVWLAAAAARADRELACDAAVLRLLNDADRDAYGECVVRVVEHVSTLHAHPATLGVFGSARHLRRRIDMIAHRPARCPLRRTARSVLSTAALAVIAAAAIAGEPPAQPTSSPAQVEAATLARMSQTVAGRQHFQATPIGEAIDRVARLADAKVRVEWDALAAAGVTRQTPVTATLLDVKLGKTLQILFGQTKAKIDFDADGDAIVVSTDADIASKFGITQTYDLGALLKPGGSGQAGDATARAATAAQVQSLVIGTIDSDSWAGNGGKAGTAELRGEQLVIRQTRRRQAMIATLLERMTPEARAAAAAAPPATVPAATGSVGHANATLDRPLGAELRLDGVPFTTVIDQLRQSSKTPFFANWSAIEGAGVPRETPITVALPGDVTFGKALSIVLSAAGGGVAKLGYTADDGVIVISTREDLSKNVATRTYDIRDLLVHIPDFGVAATRPVDVQKERAELVTQLTHTIQATIEPDDWKVNGGLIGAIQELGGQLIVTNTPRAHEAIARLLREIREGRAVQVNVEARFMTVDVDKLPPAFDRLMRAAKKDSPLGETFFLDDLDLSEWQKATATDPSVKTLAAPRLTLFNGQQAFVKVAQPLEYVKSYSLTKTVAGERRYEPVMETTMTTGCSTMIQTTVSADRKYVTTTVHPTITTLLKMENVPFPTPEEGKSELVIQRPILDVQELRTTVSVPDRGTILMTAGGASGANGKQLLVILIKPTVIVQREIEPAAFPLLERK